MNGQHGERGRQAPVWDLRPAAGWGEYVASRERFLALLAAQSASWTAARRLPARAPGELRSPPGRPGRRSPVAVSTRNIFWLPGAARRGTAPGGACSSSTSSCSSGSSERPCSPPAWWRSSSPTATRRRPLRASWSSGRTCWPAAFPPGPSWRRTEVSEAIPLPRRIGEPPPTLAARRASYRRHLGRFLRYRYVDPTGRERLCVSAFRPCRQAFRPAPLAPERAATCRATRPCGVPSRAPIAAPSRCSGR